MTAPHIVDPAHVLGNLLAEASPDMMRQLLQNMINQLLSADADLVLRRRMGTGGKQGWFRNETATATVPWTPASAPSMSPSPSSVLAATSPSGCWSAANAPKPP